MEQDFEENLQFQDHDTVSIQRATVGALASVMIGSSYAPLSCLSISRFMGKTAMSVLPDPLWHLFCSIGFYINPSCFTIL